jgi:hypothetical protein
MWWRKRENVRHQKLAFTAEAVNSNIARLLLLLLSVLVSPADNDISISQVDAAAGETVTVTVSLANASLLPGIIVVIDYDLNRIVPVAYRAAGRASTDPLPDGDDGQFLNLIIDSPIPLGSGPIIDIDFRVRDDELPGIIPLGNGYIRVPPTGPPGLTLSFSQINALEADPPVIGTITLHNVASPAPTRVTLQTADSARAAPPAFIDIPASANSAQFEIQLPNDLIFGPDVDVLITASAVDIGSDSVTLHVRDDDEPATANLLIGAASPGTPVGLFSNTVTIDDVEIAESATLTFSVSAGLSAREELDFVWTLDGQIVANSASFSYAPGFDHVAHPAEFVDHSLVCRVTDSATATWQFRVSDEDRSLPPEIEISFHPLSAIVTAIPDPDGDSLLGLDVHWQAPDGSIVQGDTAPDARADETWVIHAGVRTAPYGQPVTRETVLSVTYPNTPPVAEDASFSIPPDTEISIDLPGSDIDDEALSFSISRPPLGQISDLDSSSGSLSYQPPPGFAGIDSFDYQVNGLVTGTIEIEVGIVTFTLALELGWNLISLPITPLEPASLLGAPLRWQDGFATVSVLDAGVGYFVHRQTAGSFLLHGAVPAQAPALSSGWNLIGPVAPPPFELQPSALAWCLLDGRYRQVRAMQPGRGYWIYMDEDK